MPLLTEERYALIGKEIKALLGNRRLILASNSPRRRQILSEIGLTFEVISPNIEEHLNSTPPARHVVKYSLEKVKNVSQQVSRGIILGADTIVVLESEMLGKPKSKEEAFQMLSKLSGQTHTVYSGVAVLDVEKSLSLTGYQTTEVVFNQLNDAEIERYLSTGEYVDKAGAYGIQGMGSLLVKEIKGDLDNVIGLPLATVGKLLAEVV
jgi:septum formation protein